MDDGICGFGKNLFRNRCGTGRKKIIFFYHMSPPFGVIKLVFPYETIIFHKERFL